MKRSTERILTTHAGSLARSPEVIDLLSKRITGEGHDQAVFDAKIREAVTESVHKQAESGVDVVSDGELSKPQFSDYVAERLNGFEGHNPEMGFVNPSQRPAPFPEYTKWRTTQNTFAFGLGALRRPMCIAPLSWNTRAYEDDIANLKAALDGTDAVEGFVPSPSPGILAQRIPNVYYPTEEAYLYALAEVMKEEYKAITDAGFVLQIDAPDVALSWDRQNWPDLPTFLKMVELRTEALNHALADVPEEQVRYHVCWGNSEEPHTNDVDLRDIVGLILKVKAAAYSIEASNPRHAHEWKVWEDVKLPEGKMLLPGVIESCSNYVEHPELVAQRIEQYARLVGKENVMAGTDCGFGTGATPQPRVHPEVVWGKFRVMAEGAEIASKRLWG